MDNALFGWPLAAKIIGNVVILAVALAAGEAINGETAFNPISLALLIAMLIPFWRDFGSPLRRLSGACAGVVMALILAAAGTLALQHVDSESGARLLSGAMAMVVPAAAGFVAWHVSKPPNRSNGHEGRA